MQGGEIIIILVVALLVLGPERLPQLARKLGGWSVELRKAASDLRAGLEAEVGDVSKIRDDIRGPIDEVRGQVKDMGRQIEDTSADMRRLGWVGPDPKSGPTAADALADLDRIEGSGAGEAAPGPDDTGGEEPIR